jgi:hypothetical protein
MKIKIQCDPKLSRVLKGELELRQPQHRRPKRLTVAAATKRKGKGKHSKL